MIGQRLRLAQTGARTQPGLLAYYEVALDLCAYFDGDLRSAVAWVLGPWDETPKPDNPNFHIVAAATFAEAGMLQEDKYEADWLSQNEADLVRSMRAELSARLGSPGDLDRMMSSLRKAGLPVGN